MFPDIKKEYIKDFSLASQVFGHRVKTNQTIYEYIIEFLQVVISKKRFLYDEDKKTDYENNFIIKDYFPITEDVKHYRIQINPVSRVGLKRFIFFRKSKFEGKYQIDVGAYERCKEIIKNNLIIDIEEDFIDDEFVIKVLEQLLYGFRAVVNNRCWFAQSTLPICPELILPETLGDKKSRKKLGKYKDGLEEVDQEFIINKYSHMSRGGELYYLHILSALNSNIEYTESISKGLKELISQFPQVSLISNFISDLWEAESGCESRDDIIKTLGTIPDGFKRREKYTLIELDNFLKTNIHPFEKIDILSYGIILQMIRMFHEQACYETKKNNPYWIMDIRINNESDIEIKKIATKNYSNFEQDILDALYINFNSNNEEENKIIGNAIKDTYKLYRKIGKEIGIIIPLKGPGMRFTLSERIIKFLVLSIIKPHGKLTLDTFLDKLYEHYGMIIDSRHYEIEMKKNKEIYLDDLSMLHKNKISFQEMLKKYGFLRDLSDSTSIIENPYDGGEYNE